MRFFSGKPTILVDIIGENGVKSSKKYPIEENSVVIREAKRGRGPAAYKPTFDKDCLIYYTVGFWKFKRLKVKLMLMESANSCVKFVGKRVDRPIWGRVTSEKLFEANVIKSAGASTQKLQIPMMLYVFLFVITAISFMTFLVVTGKVRI